MLEYFSDKTCISALAFLITFSNADLLYAQDTEDSLAWIGSAIELNEQWSPSSAAWRGAGSIASGASKFLELSEAPGRLSRGEGRDQILADTAVKATVGFGFQRLSAALPILRSCRGHLVKVAGCLALAGGAAAVAMKIEGAAGKIAKRQVTALDNLLSGTLKSNTLIAECGDMDWYEGKCDKGGQSDTDEQPIEQSKWRIASIVRSDNLETPTFTECNHYINSAQDFADGIAASYGADNGCNNKINLVNPNNVVVSFSCSQEVGGETINTSGNWEIFGSETIFRTLETTANAYLNTTTIIETQYEKCAPEPSFDCSAAGQAAYRKANPGSPVVFCPNPL